MPARALSLRTPLADLPPGFGWLAVGAVVAAWDLANQRSLSSAAQRRRAVTLVVGGVTLAHLLGILPESVDPFRHVAVRVRKQRQAGVDAAAELVDELFPLLG